MKQAVLGFFLFLSFSLILSAFIINGGPENIHPSHEVSFGSEHEYAPPHYPAPVMDGPQVNDPQSREAQQEEIKETLRQCLDLAQDAYNTDIDDLNNLRLPIPVGDETKTKNMFRLELQESEENCRRAASNAEESLS